MLFASLLLLMTSLPLPSTAAAKGSREDDLVLHYYTNITEAYLALKSGEIDMVLYDLSQGLVADAMQDANLVLAPVADSIMYEFDLNNNYSIADYPGIRSPMNYTEMRQAIAFLSNKDYYVSTLLGGFAERIDQPVAAPYKGWANASLWYPHYPYEYDPEAAKALLDIRFPEGTTLNPYYDPLNPLSSQFLRQYPSDHPQKAGQDLDPLKFMVRVDSTPRLQAGRGVVDWMRSMGVPIDLHDWVSSSSWWWNTIFYDRNYHFYTGGWTVGRFPPLTLYSLFHSDNAFPGGSNYVTGNGTHPKLDALLYNCKYADSYSQAVSSCKLACSFLTEQCVTVPLWSPKSYVCYSKRLQGVVNMEGRGPENSYTFMNAYKTDGSPIRMGCIREPAAVNIIFSGWVYDYNTLDRMNLYGGVDFPPYNLAGDQAGFIRDWDTTTWNDGGTNKTKVVQTYRSNGYFVEPVTGSQTANVNATHYYISAWYHYQNYGWFFTNYAYNLHHIDITGEYTSEIYFDTLSYWNTYYAQGPLLPIDMWAEHPELITKHNETIVNPVAPGFVATAGDPVWFTSVTFNGTSLTLGPDYNIVKGQLYVYDALGPGTLEVEYWAVGDPRGYTPGDLPWEIIFEGAGMYYATAFTPGADGGVTLKRNPFYYMETPPLGEIDFVRKPNGAYKIDIYDLALAAGAFASQGTGFPSKNWFPGADLAPNGGVIDIYDEVTVTGINWDQEYDFPE
jgi:hypothetical protein